MCADNTSAGLSVLGKCTTDTRQWYLQNGLQLDPDKSEALIARTIDREFVTSAKKYANFNEFSEIKKIRKNS